MNHPVAPDGPHVIAVQSHRWARAHDGSGEPDELVVRLVVMTPGPGRWASVDVSYAIFSPHPIRQTKANEQFGDLAMACGVRELTSADDLLHKAFIGELKSGRLIAVRRDAIRQTLCRQRLDAAGLKPIPVWDANHPPPSH